jgi:hypothetical protein
VFLEATGLSIVVSPHAYKMTIGDRKFPISRHRSLRTYKKLLKRHGGEFHIIRKPMMYRTGNTLIMHPTLYEEFKKQCISK